MMKRVSPRQRPHCKLTRKKSREVALRALAGLAVIVFTCFSNGAYAQNISASQAAEHARQITQGKVLQVKPTKTINGNKIHYRVKVLSPEGRVIHLIIDGDNGDAHPRPQKLRRKHEKHPPKTHYTEADL
ncbi:MAG: putative membrane protein YkoI [Candidatus Endobugula sp.]|jgi:uncharacterized membrane protein YkoI